MSKSLERWLEPKGLSPFREISELQDSFEQLFREITGMKRGNGIQTSEFSPACEISEDEEQYTMKFDLPGVTKDQVQVDLENDRLTVRAERREEKKQEDRRRYLSEISYGSYIRSFMMPGPVDEKKVEAGFNNGVLTVTVPKSVKSKAKQIPVQ